MKKLLIIALILGLSVWLIRHHQDKVSAEQRCINNGWNPENRFKWWDESDVCYFPDESFCFIDDFSDWKCSKWDYHYGDEEYYNEALAIYINEESDTEIMDN